MRFHDLSVRALREDQVDRLEWKEQRSGLILIAFEDLSKESEDIDNERLTVRIRCSILNV